MLSCGPELTEAMWYIAMCGIKSACHVSVYSLQQLMTPFLPNSDNFYGDIGHVKVAVRKDQSEAGCDRLCHLAHQVSVNTPVSCVTLQIRSVSTHPCHVSPRTPDEYQYTCVICHLAHHVNTPVSCHLADQVSVNSPVSCVTSHTRSVSTHLCHVLPHTQGQCQHTCVMWASCTMCWVVMALTVTELIVGLCHHMCSICYRCFFLKVNKVESHLSTKPLMRTNRMCF